MIKIQQTFKNNNPTIYIVGTPIGNLNDFSIRAIDTLKNVSLICCEDTRTSKTLLSKYNIKTKLVSLHKYNELERVDSLLNSLKENKSIGIISDAGVPTISDPGALLLSNLLKQEINFNITSLNVGPAYVHAIVNSGFVSKKNYFYGFIESKSKQAKIEELTKIITKYNNDSILSFYESVHRIKDTINDLLKILNPNQELIVARELTKLNEEIIRGNIIEINKYLQSENFIEKGEFVVVIDKFDAITNKTINEDIIANEINEYIQKGFKLKQASEIVANLYNLKKNDVYTIYLKKFKNS